MRAALIVLLALAGCRAGASKQAPERVPNTSPRNDAPLALAQANPRVEIPHDWWQHAPGVADAPRWAQVAGGGLVLPTGERLEIPATRAAVLAVSDTRAIVSLYLEPLALVADVPLEALERTFIVRPTPLIPDEGEPWVELAPGSEVTPVTIHALEDDLAPVIVEAFATCDPLILRGSVPSAAIGRVVERGDGTRRKPGDPVRVQGRARLEDEAGNERVVLPFTFPGMGEMPGGFSASALTTGENGRIKIHVPFAYFSLEGWVAAADVTNDSRRSSNDNPCATRVEVEQPTGEPRETSVSLPEQACLYNDDQVVAAVFRPPHLTEVGTVPQDNRDIAPEPMQVGAQRLDSDKWRVWIPTRGGEVSFVAVEHETGAFELCPHR